jgi:hypothetical protein
VWSQQGPKLAAADAIGSAGQGFSVALSPDGNTAIVGGCCDNGGAGAAWVYARSGGVWIEQAKLAGAVGSTLELGRSVSLSSDGNNVLLGGSGAGAAWVYARSGGVWGQQAQLSDAGVVDSSSGRGAFVSLAGDGNTAIIGGPAGAGAAWLYTRSGGTWIQQTKLVGTGAIAISYFLSRSPGTGISLSSAAPLTILEPAPRGCLRAWRGCGPSRRSWSAQAP